jgi:hypothetical protein
VISFFCEGCGVQVYALGRETVSRTGLCAVCEWLCEHVPDPEAMMALRARLDVWGSPPPSGRA